LLAFVPGSNEIHKRLPPTNHSNYFQWLLKHSPLLGTFHCLQCCSPKRYTKLWVCSRFRLIAQHNLYLKKRFVNTVNSRFGDPCREFSRQRDHAGMYCKSINTVKLDLVTSSLRFDLMTPSLGVSLNRKLTVYTELYFSANMHLGVVVVVGKSSSVQSTLDLVAPAENFPANTTTEGCIAKV
jgi:hypothetical protein